MPLLFIYFLPFSFAISLVDLKEAQKSLEVSVISLCLWHAIVQSTGMPHLLQLGPVPVPVVVLREQRLCLVQPRTKLVPTLVTHRAPGSVALEVDLCITGQTQCGSNLWWLDIHVLLLLHEHLPLIHHVHLHPLRRSCLVEKTLVTIVPKGQHGAWLAFRFLRMWWSLPWASYGIRQNVVVVAGF